MCPFPQCTLRKSSKKPLTQLLSTQKPLTQLLLLSVVDATAVVEKEMAEEE